MDLSLKTPTREKPWPSNSVTVADSQNMSSQDLWAPFAVAGLKILASVWVAEDCQYEV